MSALKRLGWWLLLGYAYCLKGLGDAAWYVGRTFQRIGSKVLWGHCGYARYRAKARIALGWE